jgi:hypothetical protein
MNTHPDLLNYKLSVFHFITVAKYFTQIQIMKRSNEVTKTFFETLFKIFFGDIV